MGDQMIRFARLDAAVLAASLCVTSPVCAQDMSDAKPLQPAAGIELWASTDSDKTSVVKLSGRALWRFDGTDTYQGVDIERAWFSPDGQRARKQTRVYADLAGALDQKWQWNARIGSNGDTALGSAALHARDWSQEIFVEREIVETPRGVDEGLYYTFAGASTNLVATGKDTLSATAGIQKFTGRNDRFHLRGTFVHVIRKKLGLSVQMRVRYFYSTVPGEFDYYSPRDFIQAVPVLQLRRFDKNGWMFLVAAGYGVQKATASQWQGARLADLRVESPKSGHRFQAFAEIQYANSSLIGAAANYDYVVGRLGLTTKL